MNEMNERFVLCEYERGVTKRDFILDRTKHTDDKDEPDDGFTVFDLGDLLGKQKKWSELLPRVRPFYAVKCRPYLPIVKVMTALGLGFDCASKGEMSRILSLGVDPTRIVYSHTRKQVSSLDFAARNGIDLMTFDDEYELKKIQHVFPTARLLLRFALYDASATYPMGIKFGCRRENALELLRIAKNLQLNVVGVHFHIGTGSKTPGNYRKAIAYSRELFDAAKEIGFKFSILDIGGGFPGLSLTTGKFDKFAEAVNAGLAEHFPEGCCDVDIIAEPGSYYMESAGTVVAQVIGKRKRSGAAVVTQEIRETSNGLLSQHGPVNGTDTTNHHEPAIDSNTELHFDYYVNDGIYTSIMDHLYEPPTSPQPLKSSELDIAQYSGAIYGYTCCETDTIMRNCSIPELEQGDWVFFEDKGDYSHMVTNFNGFGRPITYYAVPNNYSRMLRRIIDGKETTEIREDESCACALVLDDDMFQLLRDSTI